MSFFISDALAAAPAAQQPGLEGMLFPLAILAILAFFYFLFLRPQWSYDTARGVAKVISFIGWLFVGLCTVASVFMVIETGGFSHLFNGPGAIVLAPILIGAIAGFLLVAAGQVLRATVDSADNTGQILALIKTWALEKNTSISNTKT